MMITSSCTVATEHGSRYLQQLCKHWSHKFAVEFDQTHGRIAIPGSTCTLDAGPSALQITLQVEGDGDIARMESVVADHIERFAFRETLAFDWTREDAKTETSIGSNA